MSVYRSNQAFTRRRWEQREDTSRPTVTRRDAESSLRILGRYAQWVETWRDNRPDGEGIVQLASMRSDNGKRGAFIYEFDLAVMEDLKGRGLIDSYVDESTGRTYWFKRLGGA